MIGIVDYGMGNVGSIRNMLSRIGAAAFITSNPQDLSKASKIVLPGVGAFDQAMERLDALGYVSVLKDRVQADGVPTLGVCLGMQLLTNGSDEGSLPGLGWIDARARRFPPPSSVDGLPVPHMGWNSVSDLGDNAILSGLRSDARFYFAHSYFVECVKASDQLGSTTYGIEFASVIGHDNVMGVQFHPEKSHRHGMDLLAGFARS